MDGSNSVEPNIGWFSKAYVGAFPWENVDAYLQLSPSTYATAIDLACGWIAFKLDGREERFPALRLLMQRFGYRQLLYAVVLRALYVAATGPKVGWGKLERTGSVAMAEVAEPEGLTYPQAIAA